MVDRMVEMLVVKMVDWRVDSKVDKMAAQKAVLWEHGSVELLVEWMADS